MVREGEARGVCWFDVEEAERCLRWLADHGKTLPGSLKHKPGVQDRKHIRPAC